MYKHSLNLIPNWSKKCTCCYYEKKA